MWHFCFRKRYSWLLFVLIACLLAACNGSAEEEATAQALVEQLVSTNTPPPTATEPPPPTDTPVPPTDTPPPPTDIPPTLTNTPEPTPTPLADSLLTVEDPLDDSFNCDTQTAVTDQEVDIASISAARQENSLIMQVLLNSPLVNDYSFAVLLTLVSGQSLNYYMWEIHETVLRVGQIDSQTGELLAGTGGLQIEHDQTAGSVTYTIPISSTAVTTATTSISNTTVISGTNTPLQQFYVASFHTPQQDQPKNCDTAGPYEFR
jgi:hypothetical protein